MCGSSSTLDGRLRGDPLFTSAPAPSRVFLENQELRTEVTKLRAEVTAHRDGARMPPPPLPAQVQGGLNEESLLTKINALLERKLSGICPPAPIEDRRSVPVAKSGRRGSGKPIPSKSRSVSRSTERSRKSSKAGETQTGKPAKADSGTWADVVGRREKQRSKAQAKAAKPFSGKGVSSGGKGSLPKAPGKGAKGAREALGVSGFQERRRLPSRSSGRARPWLAPFRHFRRLSLT